MTRIRELAAVAALALALPSCSNESRSSAPAELCEGVPTEVPFVIATEPIAGAHISDVLAVRGCSRTFESTIGWRLVALNGLVVARGHATGGGVDGPDVFQFEIDLRPLEPGLHHLEVFEPRVTDEGHPPGRTVLPVVVVAAD